MKSMVWSAVKVPLTAKKVDGANSYEKITHNGSTISVLAHAGIGASWGHNVMAFAESRVPLQLFSGALPDLIVSGSFFRYNPKKKTVFEAFFDTEWQIFAYGTEKLHLNPPTIEGITVCHSM